MSQNNGNGVADPGPFVEHHDHLKHNYLERVADERRAYDERFGKDNAAAKVAAALGYESTDEMRSAVAVRKADASNQKKASGS